MGQDDTGQRDRVHPVARCICKGLSCPAIQRLSTCIHTPHQEKWPRSVWPVLSPGLACLSGNNRHPLFTGTMEHHFPTSIRRCSLFANRIWTHEKLAGLLHKTDRMRRLHYPGIDAMTYRPMDKQGVSPLNLSHPIGLFHTIHFTPRQTDQSDEGVIHTHTHKATLTGEWKPRRQHVVTCIRLSLPFHETKEDYWCLVHFLTR